MHSCVPLIAKRRDDVLERWPPQADDARPEHTMSKHKRFQRALKGCPGFSGMVNRWNTQRFHKLQAEAEMQRLSAEYARTYRFLPFLGRMVAGRQAGRNV